jgi:DNA topoisomerase-1
VAQIHYRKESDRTLCRVKSGRSFRFVDEKGKAVTGTSADRIRKLAIPPAWKDVVISPDPLDYIQAIGVDARGRRQYIYHPEWVKRNQEYKFDQMIAFGERLPDLRKTVSAHMREHRLSEDRVLATVVWLLEHTFIRVGNTKYAEEDHSYGLTTMRDKHVSIKGSTMTFSFEGKSGVFHELEISDPRVAKTVRECVDIPGFELFQYLDEKGRRKSISSEEVNTYLKTYTGADFSAKDFRTWGGSVLAGDSLYKKGNAADETDLKHKIAEVVEIVSDHLGNTKSVCRKYYIHPVIFESYEKKILVPHFKRSYERKSTKKLGLTVEEYATWSLIKDS